MFIACIMLFLHVHAQRKQAQRELIYIKARHEAEQIKQQRHMQYKKRLEEQKLKREVEKGYIVDDDGEIYKNIFLFEFVK